MWRVVVLLLLGFITRAWLSALVPVVNQYPSCIGKVGISTLVVQAVQLQLAQFNSHVYVCFNALLYVLH